MPKTRLSSQLLASCLLSTLALSARGAAPELASNEEIVKTLDGCGMVMDKTHPGAQYIREAFSKITWGGACIDGLAMGRGVLSAGVKFPDQTGMLPSIGWVWYGRTFGPREIRWDNGSVQQNFIWEKKFVSYRLLDGAAVWSKDFATASMVNDGDVTVRTQLINEPVVIVDDVEVRNPRQYACPKGPPEKKCEKLWIEHAGPVIERIKAFLAENEPKAQARISEVQTLVAQWQAEVGPALVAQRESDAQRGMTAEYERSTRQAAWEKGCWDKLHAAPSIAAPGLRSEAYTRHAQYLQKLFTGECANHTYAKNGLAEAKEYLANAAQYRKEEEQERLANAQRAKNPQPASNDSPSLLAAVGELANAYVKYHEAKNGGGSSSASSYDEPAPVQSSTNSDESSTQHINKCDAEIKRVQAESESWPGNLSARSRRLGEYQKDMFEGRCSAHPQASMYVASANNMVAAAGSRASSGEMVNDCLSGEVRADGRKGLRNSCSYDVEFYWCVQSPDPDSWSTALDCAKDKFGGGAVKAHEWTGHNMNGQTLHWIACKMPDTPHDVHFDASKGRAVGTCYDW